MEPGTSKYSKISGERSQAGLRSARESNLENEKNKKSEEKMKKDNVIKTIKEINPETVILIQIGAFYHAYGKDAYILSYLCDYQIKSVENSYNTCGFPKSRIK